MIGLRNRSEQGSGIVSAFIGLVFVCVFLVAISKLSEMVILTQRLNSLAANSVRRLSVSSAINNPEAFSATERDVSNSLPKYRANLSYSLVTDANSLTFTIFLHNYSIIEFSGLGSGSYTLSASATSHMES